MAPVINRMTWTVVRAVDDALMCADWLPLGDDLEAIGIDAQADSAIGERGRYAIAIALKVDETGRRYPFAIFHKTIEGPARNQDRKSTRLNQSLMRISSAVFCLTKKKYNNTKHTT